jgi:hypothetical protein
MKNIDFKQKALAINSILIVISSSIIGTVLHESAHYVTAYYLNLKPEMHHNYVLPLAKGTEQQFAIMAAAGPLFSLIFGIIILFISIKYLKPSLFKLFMTWLGMGSILCLFGYLLIAPFAKEGDTGRVFDYLGVPIYLSIGIAIVSFIFINKVFEKCVNQFVFYKNNAIFDKLESQKQLFIYPIYGSIIIMTLLNLPIITWISLLPTIFMPMTYFATMGEYKKLNVTDANVTVDKVSIPLSILTLLTIFLFRYLV